ncbi:B3 domain-containing protein [Pyrus ussuriensis x Pyrus communis]|uniref:B3 domain-containing protein n=1 Tax=Pyrus ussuriensis x Pyrus communis TaxID=2448454 RepID=A0A5N5H248_9ROSA|nr:B3 domain-containing protein [Pyrus ussuriensis x Pyrus communis]
MWDNRSLKIPTTITWDDVRKLKFESFNKLLAKVKAIARNRDEELDLLQKRVVIDLVEFERKAAKKFRLAKKRKATSAYYDEEKPASVCYHQKDRKLDYRSSSRSRRDEYESYKNCDEDLEEQRSMSMMKKKKQKPAKKVANTKPSAPSIPSPMPELPNEFKEKIASLHGYQVQLVIQKQLFKTDFSSGLVSRCQ